MKKRGIAISLMLLAMIVASCGNKDKNRQFNSFSVDDLPHPLLACRDMNLS